MKRFYLSVIYLLISMMPVFGQSPFAVLGTVVDAEEKALSGASVFLLNAGDSSQVDGAFTDKDGFFAFERIMPGEYVLRVSFVGYKPLSRSFRKGRGGMNFGQLKLEQTAIGMESVTVEDFRILAVLKGDTAEYSTDNFRTAPDATAENLMQKIPGSTVQNGSVEVQGEKVKKVLVDSRPFFGEDPSATLKNIPAEIVQQIQIYDEQSEQAKFTGFDDGETSKTVNLVTRPEFRKGTFGKAAVGAGDRERYTVGGNYNRFNDDKRISLMGQSNNINDQSFSSIDLLQAMGSGSRPSRHRPGASMGDFMYTGSGGLSTVNAGGFNYTQDLKEESELTASYFINSNDNTTLSSVREESLLDADSGTVWLSDRDTENGNLNHRADLRLEYQFSETDNILIVPSMALQSNSSGQTYSGTRIGIDGLDPYSYTTTNSSEQDAQKVNSMILWRHKFDRPGRTLSLRFHQDLNKNSGISEQVTTEIFDGILSNDSLDQRSSIDNTDQRYGGEMDITEALNENFSLQFSYEPTFTMSSNEKYTHSPDPVTGDYSVLDTLYSSVFDSRSESHEIGLGLRFNKGGLNISAQGGVDIFSRTYSETFPVRRELLHEHNDLLSSLSVRYKAESGFSTRFRGMLRTDSPSLSQLQETPDLSDPLNISTGNHALGDQLKADLFGHFQIADRKKGKYTFFMLGGSVTMDYIGNNVLIAQHDTTLANGITLVEGAKYSYPVNLDGYVNLRSFVSNSIPLAWFKSNLNLNLGFGYLRTPSVINGEKNYAHAPYANIGAVLSSNISDRLDFTLSSRTTVRNTYNTLPYSSDSRTLNQVNTLQLYWNFWKNGVFRNDLAYDFDKGLSEEYNQSSLVDNMSLGVKFLKNRAGELKVTVYDVFDQSRNVSRTVTDTEIRDVSTDVIGRYAMLSFTYDFRRGNLSGMNNDMPHRPRYGHDGPPRF